jgi:hypothetical protein
MNTGQTGARPETEKGEKIVRVEMISRGEPGTSLQLCPKPIQAQKL